MAGYDQTSLGLSFPTSAPALASRCDPAVALASGSHVPATFPPFVYLNSTWHPSQAKRGARGLSRPQVPGREPELCSKGWGSRESSQQDPASCRSLRSGSGGSGSKEARLDRRRGKGPLHRPRPPPPAKSPSGRRRQLERRKHFLIPEAATHGRRGRRPPPAATQLGTQAWAFPDPSAGAFLCSPPRPGRPKEAVRGGWPRSGVSGGSRVPAFSVAWLGGSRRRSGREGPEPWPQVCRSPGSDALSTCLGCQFAAPQSAGKPRRGGAHASALTTTAVTGWPGM